MAAVIPRAKAIAREKINTATHERKLAWIAARKTVDSRDKIDQQIDQVSGKGRNRAEDDELSRGGRSRHEHFQRPRLLCFLHRAQEGLRTHYEKSVDTRAHQKERKVLDATGSKAGTDGARQKIKSRQFGEYSGQGHDETAAVADGREQIPPQDCVELVQSRSHKLERICN